MTEWIDGPLVGFDVETDSVDPTDARIIQWAIVVPHSQGVETWSRIVKPDRDIPEGASEVHGITTERAITEGMPRAEALGLLAHLLADHTSGGAPIVAYNARYDITVLDRELQRVGLKPLNASRVIDPHVMDKWLDQYRRGSRKLSAVCEHYGIKLDDAHDASADALAAVRLAWRLLHKTDAVQGSPLVERRSMWKRLKADPDDLHMAQVGWAGDQARGLRQYFERKGDAEAAASVVEDWPLIGGAMPMPTARAGR